MEEIPGEEETVLQSFAVFPNPLEILLGQGLIKCSCFNDHDGTAGLLFSFDDGSKHEVGERVETDGPHSPQVGEVYIRCTSLASAQVVLELANRLVYHFQKQEEMARERLIEG